ncbi:hypothetical protein JJE68_01216 [Pediococcus acidilactici]|nr:hypothetical protein JJE68_01216 [Pediococcus acidilactici]
MLTEPLISKSSAVFQLPHRDRHVVQDEVRLLVLLV